MQEVMALLIIALALRFFGFPGYHPETGFTLPILMTHEKN